MARHMERRNGRLVAVRTRPTRQRYQAVTAGVVMAGLFGIAALVIGLGTLYNTVQLARHGETAPAVVTEVGGGRWPQLTARYPANGVTYTEQTSRFLDEEPGDRITVVFDATAPSRFQTQSWDDAGPSGDYGFSGTMLGLGLLAIAVGLTVAFLRRSGLARL